MPELLVHEAIEDFANANLEVCVEKISRALKADPDLSDGYAYHPVVKSLYVRERIWTGLSVLHAINGGGKTYKPLKEILEIAFSPNGRRVAFMAVNNATEHVLVIDGQEQCIPFDPTKTLAT